MAGSGPHRIVVVDNGLQSTGELPLTSDGALAVDPASVAKDLSTGQQLAYLDGTEILFTGLGAARAPQQPLPPADTVKLEKIWHSVLSAGGAKVRIDTATIPDDQPVAAGMPKVGVVKPDSEKLVPVKPHCYRIRGDKVGFVGDEAAFKDPDKAIKALRPIAEDLKQNKAAATVVGTTAYKERDPSNPLSHARAKAVAGVLTDLGVDERLLVLGGVGTNFPGYRNPEVGGVRRETLAQQNRLVIISPVGESC
jgi:outer membrane protein OmpA-like peptidoglycan-associated protein